jgi:type IV pilus assembly protein PilB
LFEKGIIDLQTANRVRVEQSKTNKAEKELLLEMKVATEEQIVRAQSEMFNIPFVDLNKVVVPDELLSGVDVKLLKNLNLIPFEREGSQIKVAMVNPFDVQAIQSLQTQFKGNVQFIVHITTKDSLHIVAERFLGEAISTEVSEALEDVGDVGVTNLDTEQADSLDNSSLLNAPVARIVNSILKYAVQAKASDIHIEPLEERLRVRFRIDGVMMEKLSLPRTTSSSVVARVKILSKLKIDEKRLPQDGRIQLKFEKVQIDVRVASIPTIYGEKIVLRLLDVSEGVPPLESSGLRGKGFDDFVKSLLRLTVSSFLLVLRVVVKQELWQGLFRD